jgi:hypothetical protein
VNRSDSGVYPLFIGVNLLKNENGRVGEWENGREREWESGRESERAIIKSGHFSGISCYYLNLEEMHTDTRDLGDGFCFF